MASTPAATPDSRPNILLIIGDDMGFSDVGAFGSEVATPVGGEFVRIRDIGRSSRRMSWAHPRRGTDSTRQMGG